MNKTAVFSMAVSLGLASLAVDAARLQAVPPHMDMGVSCTCDWNTDPGTCMVSWIDTGARDYSVHVEFLARWAVDGVDMSSRAKLDLDTNWACDTSTNSCSASGAFALPEYPETATVTFDGKVKGLGRGPDGVTSRNFFKQTGACKLPVIPPDDDGSSGDDGIVIIDLTQF